MNALILLSHGSRMDRSNQEVMQLASTMADLDGTPFERVRCAFQQFAQPTFESVIEDSVREGVQNIVVFPLFLSSGSHVQVDVPEMIQAAKGRYPQLQITVTPHLGKTKALAAFLMKSVLDYASPI